MAGKALILHDNRLDDATPVASSTDADPQFDVLNLRDWRPYTFWKPTGLPATVDVDSAFARLADYLFVYGHDLHDAQVGIELRGSTDNFVASDVLLATNNIMGYPEAFDNAAWTKTGLTVSPNTALSPINTPTADKLVEDTSTGEHKIELAVPVVSGQPYTGAIAVKAAGRIWTRVYFPNEPGVAAWFNLSTGQWGTIFGTIDAMSATDLGDGWFELSLTKTFTAGASRGFAAIPAPADAIDNYTGDGSSGIFVWAARLKYGQSAGVYEGVANAPLLIRFSPASYQHRRLRFIALTGSTMPAIGIAAFGEALEIPEQQELGFDPLGREPMGQANRSVAGHPLGRVIEFEEWRRRLRFRLVAWDWIRENWLAAWEAHLRGEPFGFLWNEDYPQEVVLIGAVGGYETPHVAPNLADLEFDVAGIAP